MRALLGIRGHLDKNPDLRTARRARYSRFLGGDCTKEVCRRRTDTVLYDGVAEVRFAGPCSKREMRLHGPVDAILSLIGALVILSAEAIRLPPAESAPNDQSEKSC